MPALMLTAHCTRLIREPGTFSAQRLTSAVGSIALNGSHYGRFLGALPRITRSTESTTDTVWVAWPFAAANASANMDAIGRVLVDQVRTALEHEEGLQDRAWAEAGGGWVVNVAPFVPAVNGAVQWWESGEASVTRTRDEWPTFDQRLQPRENPTGPTVDNTTNPGGVGDTGIDLTNRAGSALSPFLWLGGAALAAYLFWKLSKEDD